MADREQAVSLPYARKYRPTKFANLRGNTRIKNSMMQMLSEGVRPQVVLISGHAGSGKTSVGRLLAQEYRCDNRGAETGACGECSSCETFKQYIQTGDDNLFMDIREYNLSRDTGKGVIDRIEDEAQIPTGEWRVFILDECHRASRSAQDSLLKLLEEPPEHVLFILCTTNPEMLLPTVLSRCQYKFSVEKPNKDECVQLLAQVCTAEGVEYDNKGLSLLAAKEDFVPRNMLNKLEQVVREQKEVTATTVAHVLNETADKFFLEFYRCFLDRQNVSSLVALLGRIRTEVDIHTFLNGLVAFTVRGIYVFNGIRVDGLESKEIANLSKVFGAFSNEEIGLLLDRLVGIQTSGDVEAKLLLLAYRGLKQENNMCATSDENLPIPEKENSSLQALSEDNFKANREVTPEQLDRLRSDAEADISVEDVLELFGANEVVSTGVDEAPDLGV